MSKIKLDMAYSTIAKMEGQISEGLARESALREELDRVKAQSLKRLAGLASCGIKREDLQQRATELEGLLREAATTCRVNDLIISANYFEAALKPAAEGEVS